jgi:hypothetical protein
MKDRPPLQNEVAGLFLVDAGAVLHISSTGWLTVHPAESEHLERKSTTSISFQKLLLNYAFFHLHKTFC